MRYNVPKGCATRSCCACVDLITCVAERYLTLRTGCEKHGRKNPLPFPYFEAVTCRQSAPDSPRERGDSQEGGNRRCLPSCAPARRQRTPPRSAERNSPLRFSEKLPARQGRTRLRQFASPTQPVQKTKSSTLFRVLLRITNAYAFLINASRRSRPLSISVSEVA